MKQFMCLFLLVGLGSSILAMDLIEKRFEVDGTPHFDLSNISGSIDVMQGDSGEVVVSAKNPNPKIEVIFTQDGNHITVETKYPKHSRNIKGGVDFEVWLPQDSNVKLNSVSGNMSLEGIEGRLSFNNVSGDILLRQIAGDIRLNNVSGNMKVRDLGESDVDANTVSGDIEFSNVSLKSGHFEFNSVSFYYDFIIIIEINSHSATFNKENFLCPHYFPFYRIVNVRIYFIIFFSFHISQLLRKIARGKE